MRPPTVLFVLGTAVPLHAATTFEPERPVYANSEPAGVFPLDFDGDGDLDLVVSGSSSVTSHENTGGSFAPGRTVVPVGSTAFPGDLDGDGDTDLLLFNRRDSGISWVASDGAGGFGEPVGIQNFADDTTAFAPADLDGDGDLDIFFKTRRSDSASYLLNEGDGTFGPTTSAALASPDHSLVAAADLDGDGRPEILANDRNGTNFANDDKIVRYAFQGAGVLSLTVADVAAGHRIIATGDIDADSDIDLVVRDYETNRIEWLANGGTADFTTGGDVGTSGFPTTAAVGPGGGVALFATFEPAVFFPRAAGGFGGPVAVAPPDLDFNALSAADLDGDGRTDVITAEDTGVRVHTRTVAGEFGNPVTVAAAITDIQAAVVSPAAGGDPAHIYIGTEAGNIFQITARSGSFSGLVPVVRGAGRISQLYLADIDGVHGADLVSIAGSDDRILWHPRNADGTFGGPVIVDDLGAFPHAAAFADLDGDGDTDIAVSYGGENACGWLSLDSAGTGFTFNALAGTVQRPRGMVARDVDGDGDVDLFCGSSLTGEVFRYTASPGGVFSAATVVGTTGTNLDTLEAADAEGDGDPDLFASESAGVSATITLFENTGAGAFAAGEEIASEGAGVDNLALADFDADGDTDIASTNFNDRRTAWRENAGDNTFTRRLLGAPEVPRPYAVTAADLDGDGDADILVTSRFVSRLGWHENTLVTAPEDDPLTAWALARGVPEAEAGDPGSDGDGDGNTLVQEFAFGLDPLRADSPLTLTGTAASFLVRRDAAVTGLVYEAETSTDLTRWTPVPVVPGPPGGGDYETAAVPFGTTHPRAFFRVVVTYTPKS